VNGFDALSGKYPNDAAIQDSIFSAKLRLRRMVPFCLAVKLTIRVDRVLLASKEIQQAEELLDDYGVALFHACHCKNIFKFCGSSILHVTSGKAQHLSRCPLRNHVDTLVHQCKLLCKVVFVANS